MTKVYKKYGATTGGYRGERAILEERVIEGLAEVSFTDQRLQLDPTSKRTLYLNNDNMAAGNYIVLPNAKDLWPGWTVSIVNDSAQTCQIYYYTDDYGQLSLFKEVAGGNMTTCILIDDNTFEGNWTTLRTSEQASADLLNKYTSDVYEEMDIYWNQIAQEDSDAEPETTIRILLGSVLAGTAVKSVYIKPMETFAGVSALTVSVGTATDGDKFIEDYDLTQAVSDNNFTKDVFEEILSNTNDIALYATFSGPDLNLLSSGAVKIVVEKARLIDPTVLKNPIVQTQIPIGVIMNYTFSDLPEGYWRLDGSVLPNAANAVPQFVNKLITINNQLPSTAKLIVGIDEWTQTYNNYGSCGKFSWQGTSLKFPAINCFIQGLSDLNQLTKLTEAGLPNITGVIGGQSNQAQWTSGAFYRYNAYGRNGGLEDWAAYADFGFDAARSNAVYGRSNTVQPQSIKFPYIISIYNKIQNASTLDLEEILEASVYKLNTSFNNITTEGVNNLKSVISTFKLAGIPNYNSVLSYSNNVNYTLDYSIWLFINTQLYNARGYIWINGVQYELGGYDDNDGHGSSCVWYMPAGTTFNCNRGTMRGWPLQ